MTQSDKGLVKIAEDASPRRHAEISPVKFKDTHPMNNKLPPAEILCGEWAFVEGWRYNDIIPANMNGTNTDTDISYNNYKMFHGLSADTLKSFNWIYSVSWESHYDGRVNKGSFCENKIPLHILQHVITHAGGGELARC